MKNHKKKIALMMALSTSLAFVGCSSNSSSEDQIAELQKQVNELKTNLNESNKKIDSLEKLMPKKSAGTFTVIASELNIRQDASEELENIGTIRYGSKVNVVDTSNPLWYKVQLNLSDYKAKDDEYTKVYTKDDGTSMEIKKDLLDKANTVYLSSRYLTDGAIKKLVEVPEGNKPFVYGLNFYDEETATLLESEIWSNMSEDLKKLGYTGVRVVMINRDEYDNNMKKGLYDAVESPPTQFAEIDKSDDCHTVFAKDVINGTTSYRGIIIANKESGIKNIKDLKGKKVLTGKEYSESGYQYQKYYLKEMEKIDVKKDLDIVPDNYHQETLYKVATGEADAGFCGDFVMTDSYGDMKYSLKLSGIDLKSKEDLEELRNNLVVFDLSEMSPIPNNPHSLKNELANNKAFVNKLYNCVKTVYSENKEGYDLTEATDKEYSMLAEME